MIHLRLRLSNVCLGSGQYTALRFIASCSGFLVLGRRGMMGTGNGGGMVGSGNGGGMVEVCLVLRGWLFGDLSGLGLGLSVVGGLDCFRLVLDAGICSSSSVSLASSALSSTASAVGMGGWMVWLLDDSSNSSSVSLSVSVSTCSSVFDLSNSTI